MNDRVSFQPLLPFEDEAAPPPRLIEELARVCRERPLEEKILVASTLAVGHQLVERLARHETSWVHLRVETVANLAHARVGPALAREGWRRLSRAQSLALVEQACIGTLEPGSYFGRLQDRPGLHRALQSTFHELWAVGILASSLPAGAFPDQKKARELAAVLRRYEEALAEGKLIDRAGVLRRALDSIRKNPPVAGPLYLLPESLELSSLERELVETIAAGRLLELQTETPDRWGEIARSSRLFRATGEENEIREIFRRILSDGTSFDEVELLYTDSQTYPPLLYELTQQYAIPCTFAEGIAVGFSRPGQAAVGFLAWIGGDFEEEELRRIVAAGAIDLRSAAPGTQAPAPVEAARALRAAGIGWGRRRHRTCLDRLIRELEEPENAHGRQWPEDAETRARQVERRQRSLFVARVIGRFLERALLLIPETPAGRVELSALARAVRSLISEFARVASRFDGTSLEALTHLFAEMEALAAAPLPVPEAARRLADAVRELHVDSDRPRPGALHAADYRSGGYSGRRKTFIAGLDDRRHPGSGRQDPVLLDEERRDINESIRPHMLAIRGDRPAENTLALQACVARLVGDVTFSFSCWNLAQSSEQFPAPFLLDVYREISGNRDADYTDLRRALPTAAGFLPAPAKALDETEWMLARLQESPGGASAESVRSIYPWLSDGRTARFERSSDRLTIYDGRIGPTDGELDPRITQKPISCSRIQTLARCPYAYFLRHVLGVMPPEELMSDPRQWLDPLALGSLLHDVFHRFFAEISALGEKPSLARHAVRLERIAEEQVIAWRERVPPRTAAAFALCREAIAVACQTLLREEQEHCRSVTPRYFEVPFGLPDAELDSDIASREPVEIPLDPRGRFLLRGRIDRIDLADDGNFHVWDYKTGSTFSVQEEKGVDAGRQAQYALYAMAAERLLVHAGLPARVTRSGYFFPGAKGQGQRLEPRLDLEETRRVVNALFNLLAEGVFPHTPEADDCKFCEFQSACGDVATVTEASQEKIASSGESSLAAFRRIREG